MGPARTDGPIVDSLLTITLAGSPGDSTTLTLVHEKLDSLWAAMPTVAEQVETGWSLVLEKLTAVAEPAL